MKGTWKRTKGKKIRSQETLKIVASIEPPREEVRKMGGGEGGKQKRTLINVVKQRGAKVSTPGGTLCPVRQRHWVLLRMMHTHAR